MLHRFATYEQAALFVAKKRSEGYYAEILHEHASVLWGPLAVSGVAAWVSEEAASEDDEIPPLEPMGPRLPTELSTVLALMVLTVLVGILALTAFGLVSHAAAYPLETGLGLLKLGIGLLCLVATAWLSSRWIHACWSHSHRLHGTASLFHATIAILLILIATDLGLWLLWTLIDFFLLR